MVLVFDVGQTIGLKINVAIFYIKLPSNWIVTYLLGRFFLKFTWKGKYFLAFVHGGVKFGHNFKSLHYT